MAANGNDNNVSVLLGNGDGTFQSAVNYAVGFGSGWIAEGDFNGDGKVRASATEWATSTPT